MIGVERWWKEIEGACDRGDVLVVCRSSATVLALQRAFIERGPGGIAGVELCTLASAIARRVPPGFRGPGAAELPDGHPWADSLKTRPRLRLALLAHLDPLHGLIALGERVDPGEVGEAIHALLLAGWGRAAKTLASEVLAAETARKPRSVLAIGFPSLDDPGSLGGQVTRHDRAFLRKMGATVIDPLDGLGLGSITEGLPAPVEVPDPLAEAQAAAEACAAAGESAGQTLLLVPDPASGQRVRALLRANAIAVSDACSLPVSSHGLWAVARELLPVFAAAGDAPLEHGFMVGLFRHPALRVLGAPGARLARRDVEPVLLACRRLRCSPSAWHTAALQAVAELEGEAARLREDDPDAGRTRSAERRLGSARVIAAQLERLASLAAEGTLEALGRFFVDGARAGLGPDEDDPRGRAIVRALLGAGDAPASVEAFEAQVPGTFPQQSVGEGVVILEHQAYDGREAAQVVVMGAHDHGAGRIAAPDPFLDDSGRRALGLPSRQGAMEERLALLALALRRSRAPGLLLYARHDADGRPVSLPVALGIRSPAGDPGWSRRPYGLGDPELAPVLASTRDERRLIEGGEAGVRDALCCRVDAEHVMAGNLFEARLVIEQKESDEGSRLCHEGRDGPDTLGHLLPSVRDALPEDLLPYLGVLGPAASGDRLPEGFVLSASRLEDFTGCLYRVFGEHLLRLGTPDEASEELSAIEQGTWLHALFEAVTPGLRWVVPEAELPDAIEAFVSRLRSRTEAISADPKKALLDHPSPAVRSALQGLLARWRLRWERYGRQRLRSPEAVASRHHRKNTITIEVERAFRASGLDEVFAQAPGLDEDAKKALKKAVWKALWTQQGDLEAVIREADPTTGMKRPADTKKAMHALLTCGDFQERLPALRAFWAKEVAPHLPAPEGDQEVVAAEFAFGAMPGVPEQAPAQMQLGRAPIPVRGKIDSIVRLRGAGAGHRSDPRPCYRIEDFKSGKAPDLSQMTEHLSRPQLVFYALAFAEHLACTGRVFPEGRVIEIAVDGIKDGKKEIVWLDDAMLSRARRVFGWLLDHARDGDFLLAPFEQCCPHIEEYGAYCDLEAACRYRSPFDATTLGGLETWPVPARAPDEKESRHA